MEDLKAQRTPGTIEVCELCGRNALGYAASCHGYSRYGSTTPCPIPKEAATTPGTETDAHQITVGGIRLQRVVRDPGPCDWVTVEVEVEGKWIEVIRELHSNYFDHFVSPNGMRAAILRAQSPHGRTEHFGRRATDKQLREQIENTGKVKP